MDVTPDKSEKPSLEPRADKLDGYPDKRQQDPSAKATSKAPVVAGIIIALIAIGVVVVVSALMFLLTLP